MTNRSIDVQTCTRVFDGFISVDEVVVKYERPDGSESGPVRRISVERGDAVGILIYVRSSDSIILVRQFRYPTLRHGDAWPLEVIAGSIDGNESAMEAAKRETREEAGLEVNELEKLAEYYSSPGGLSEMVSLFLVEVDGFPKPTGPGGLPGEDVEILALDRRHVYELLEQGHIRDGKTQVALYRFLQKNPL